MDFIKTLDQLKLMLLVGILILIGQFVSSGASPAAALPGMVLIVFIAMLALVLKDLIPPEVSCLCLGNSYCVYPDIAHASHICGTA